MSARILAGSVFDMLPTITPGSVDCVVTSPPYWMLRSYLPKGHELKAQELGSEPTVQEFISNMVRVFGLVRDCMADHGTCWLNMGDTYSGGKEGNDSYGDASSTLNNGARGSKTGEKMPSKTRPPADGIPGGNLCLIPQRLAIALQDDGWIIRSVIVWHKPAPMPASVSGWRWTKCRVKVGPTANLRKTAKRTELAASDEGHDRQASFKDRYTNGTQLSEWEDCPGCARCRPNNGLVLRRGSWRPTSSWEPILMLAKSSGYYADGEAVKTPYVRTWDESNGGSCGGTTWIEESSSGRGKHCGGPAMPGTGANPRDVQTWASEPLYNVKVRDFVYVGADEATCGMERIESSDCPVHARPQASNVPCGEHSADESSRKPYTDARPAQVPLDAPDPIPAPSSEASEPSLPSSPVAKGRSKRKNKTLPGSPTSRQGNACEETSPHTDRTSSQSACDIPRPGTSESSIAEDSASGDLRSYPSEQTTTRSADKSSSCTCSYKKVIVRELAHYASYPSALVRFCLRAGTSLRGYCPTCSAPWARIVETEFVATSGPLTGKSLHPELAGSGRQARGYNETDTLGWRPTCRCPEQEPRPGLVLDPFSGSARTGLTAIRMGLDYVGVELSPIYVEMSRKLLKQDAPLFAGGVE